MNETLLHAQDLKVHFPLSAGWPWQDAGVDYWNKVET